MKLMNFIYQSNKARKIFEQKNPDERVQSVDPSKVIVSKKTFSGIDILRLNWFFSKRINVILTDNLISFENNKINKQLLSDEQITYFKTLFGLLTYQVVSFSYNNNQYY